MILRTEQEMVGFGEELARTLKAPEVIELTGDVGVGKTTITKGIAKGLGVADEVTSPRFTLSKQYNFPDGKLVHYDFYRLQEVGIMSEDLMENVEDEKTITVIEWADSVKDLLPEGHKRFLVKLLDDGTREVTSI